MDSDVLRGLLAGAAGTTALNAATYLDMAVRGRSPSTTPERTVARTEALTGDLVTRSSSSAEQVDNRRSGLGALLGLAAGMGTGAVYGLVRPRVGDRSMIMLTAAAGVGANIAGTVPMTALGITNPREWSAESWLMDLIPHLAYGAVTAASFESMRR